jgi:hypothetical protein
MRKRRLSDNPHVWASALAARWAQRLNLPPGNLWEPAITRHILREYAHLGSDLNAKGFVEALIGRQLGLESGA